MVTLDLSPVEAQVLGGIIQEKLGQIHQQKELEKALIPLIQKLLGQSKKQNPPTEE